VEKLLGRQRLFERFSARYPVKFRHSRQEYGTNVFLEDASAQGIKITSRERLFLNDSVSLDVKLPDSENPMMLNGRVVWTQYKGPNLWNVGIEFHKVNLMKLQRIFRLAEETA
jgi:hypothetical protein